MREGQEWERGRRRGEKDFREELKGRIVKSRI
jgi:hypothetical protein